MTGFSGFIQNFRPDPEDTPDPLTRALLARGEPDPDPVDEDERQANVLATGYQAGVNLDGALGDTDLHGQLVAARRELVSAGKAVERNRTFHEQGRVEALTLANASLRLTDAQDEVTRLEGKIARRDASRRAAAGFTPPQQRVPDGVEAASRHARGVLAGLARERTAGTQAGRPERRRPFVSRGGVAARSEHCFWCTKEGLDDDTSYLLHSDPEYALPVTTAQQAQQAEEAEQAARRGEGLYPPGAVVTTGYQEISR